MQYFHLTDHMPYHIAGNILQLAHKHASELSSHVISTDSPLFKLAQAEVYELLGDALRSISSPESILINGVYHPASAGVIIAIDETKGDGTFGGFLQYKPRLPRCDSASIGYAAVSAAYRGQGVLRSMIQELLKSYPSLGLDCPLALVPLYERLGFKPVGRQGTHVAMVTGPQSGKGWAIDQATLEKRPTYMRAKEEIRAQLGKQTRDAYAQRDEDDRAAAKEVDQFLASRGIPTPRR
jgi:ribosomal protein S18 acetylase RimI-like enzyme